MAHTGEPLKVAIVIPCFNEEDVLKLTHSRILSVAHSLAQELNFQCEIVYIDDGSRDRTLDILHELAEAPGEPVESEAFVKIVSLSRNFGHQAAMAAGLAHARGDFIVTIDADLQDPPELIPAMVRQALAQKLDVVHARRLKRRGESGFKLLTAFCYYRVLRFLSGNDVLLDVGDFRLMSRRVTDIVIDLPERSLYLRGLLPELGYPQGFIDYDRPERAAGETKYTLRKMVSLAIQGVMAVSSAPLRAGLTLGLLTASTCLLYVLWIILQKLAGVDDTVRGWPSMMVALLFLGAVQLITMGILGEYIGQIHKEVRRRPRFFVNAEQSVNLADSQGK